MPGWDSFQIQPVYVTVNAILKVFLVQDLVFDLGDCVRWEFMFPSNEKPILEIPDLDDDGLDAFDEDEVITNLYFTLSILLSKQLTSNLFLDQTICVNLIPLCHPVHKRRNKK